MGAACAPYLFWTLFCYKDILKWNNKEISFSITLHIQIETLADQVQLWMLSLDDAFATELHLNEVVDVGGRESKTKLTA